MNAQSADACIFQSADLSYVMFSQFCSIAMKRLISCGAEAIALLGSVTSVIPADALSALAARMTLGMTLTPYPQHCRK